MNKSSTEYLDKIMLDDKGLVTKEVLSEIKGYCGLFGFIISICNTPNIGKEEKAKLINNVLDSAINYMRRKYEANLSLYSQHASKNLESGKLFKTLSELPAKMREDYEAALRILTVTT